jgi:AcrR family transcriptional regulator
LKRAAAGKGAANDYDGKYRHGGHEDRRSHILEAAFGVLIELGYAKTKMEDIARAAGYGKSTLYEYFAGKDEILYELLQTKFVDRYNVIAAEADAQGSPEESIRAFLSAEMDLILEYGSNENLMSMITTRPAEMFSNIVAEAAHRIILLKHRHIMRYVKAAISAGAFVKTDPFVASSLIIGAASSYMMTVTSPEFKEYAGARDNAQGDKERREAFFTLVFRALKK